MNKIIELSNHSGSGIEVYHGEYVNYELQLLLNDGILDDEDDDDYDDDGCAFGPDFEGKNFQYKHNYLLATSCYLKTVPFFSR